MEYLNKHQEITNSEFEKVGTYIIQKLTAKYNIGTNSMQVFNDVAKLVSEQFLSNNLIYKHYSELGHIYSTFSNHENTFEKKRVDTIKAILSNHVFQEFTDTINNNIKNTFFPKNIRELKFEEFCTELLKYDVYIKCCGILRGNNPLIWQLLNIFYENNDYSNFKSSMLINNPSKQTLEKIAKKYNFKIKSPETNVDNKELNIPKDILKEVETVKFNLSKFSNQEKAYLLHVCYNSKLKLPRTEFIKLMVICNLEDISVLYQTPGNNNLYRRFNEGLLSISKNEVRQFIDDIIDKIKYFNLVTLNKELNSIKKKIK